MPPRCHMYARVPAAAGSEISPLSMAHTQYCCKPNAIVLRNTRCAIRYIRLGVYMGRGLDWAMHEWQWVERRRNEMQWMSSGSRWAGKSPVAELAESPLQTPPSHILQSSSFACLEIWRRISTSMRVRTVVSTYCTHPP